MTPRALALATLLALTPAQALLCPRGRPCTVPAISLNPVTLPCPGGPGTVTWLRTSPLRLLRLSGGTCLLPGGALRLAAPWPRDSGVYTCRRGDVTVAYYDLAVQDVEQLHVSHVGRGQVPLGPRGPLFTAWTPWQACDRCGVPGERKQPRGMAGRHHGPEPPAGWRRGPPAGQGIRGRGAGAAPWCHPGHLPLLCGGPPGCPLLAGPSPGPHTCPWRCSRLWGHRGGSGGAGTVSRCPPCPGVAGGLSAPPRGPWHLSNKECTALSAGTRVKWTVRRGPYKPPVPAPQVPRPLPHLERTQLSPSLLPASPRSQPTMTLTMALSLLWVLLEGVAGGHWGAWMPLHISAFEGTCVAVPCRFDFPEELRPATVHGLWYYNSPYPKNYPPVVFKSRTSIVHESFQGRTRLLGDLQAHNCSLLITRLSPELAGKYYFRADLGGYNQYTYSDHSNLEIVNKPTIMVPLVVVEGAEVELRCLVPDNCPEMRPVVTWQGHEELAEQTVQARLEETDGNWTQVSGVRFLPSRRDHGRTLACRVTYTNTTFEFEDRATLDVKYEPHIVEMTDSLEATEGASVVLACAADASPVALLTWAQGAAVLAEEPGTRLELQLYNVTPAHDGIYTCVAENVHGRANRSLGLTVFYAPRPPVINASGVAVEGEPVTIACSTESNPEPILSLLKERRVLATAVYERQLALDLPGVTHEDDGEYWCVAENQYGQQATAFNLTVEFTPIILPESRCTAGRDTVQCICAVKANPEAAVTFELPTRNVSLNESAREVAQTERAGYALTSILTLRGELDSQLYVLCAARNAHGARRRQLHFHHANSLMWAKVGPVGAVVAFAILIAIVCYISQTRKKKSVNESSSFIQTENPPVVYSGDLRPSLHKSEFGWRPASDKRLLSKREGSLDLDVDYANIDFAKLSTKDSYTLTEELAEYAEIRVK